MQRRTEHRRLAPCRSHEGAGKGAGQGAANRIGGLTLAISAVTCEHRLGGNKRPTSHDGCNPLAAAGPVPGRRRREQTELVKHGPCSIHGCGIAGGAPRTDPFNHGSAQAHSIYKYPSSFLVSWSRKRRCAARNSPRRGVDSWGLFGEFAVAELAQKTAAVAIQLTCTVEHVSRHPTDALLESD